MGELTLTDAQNALKCGDISSVELVQATIDAADAHDEQLGVFVSRFSDAALRCAKLADSARREGKTDPLLGIPIGVKDNLSTMDGETTAQSLVLDRSWGSGDSVSVARLRAAGAVVVGKTTLSEFALGVPYRDMPFPLPRNPWSPGRWAGGSSSGSGSGVVTGMMLGGVGTDTGSSVRMPAALCGLSSIKPTFGRIPKSLCVPLSYTLDAVGPLARSAEDCAQMLQVMSGFDASDRYSSKRIVDDYVGGAQTGIEGVRIGVDRLSGHSGSQEDHTLQELFSDFLNVLQSAGAKLVDVELPYYREMSAASVLTVLSEGLAYHTPDLRSRYGDFFPSSRVGLSQGLFVNGADYIQAQRVRRIGQLAVAELFRDVDLVVTPTVSRPAPRFSEVAEYQGTFFEGKNLAFHTGYWNAIGYPASAIPIGFNREGLPLSAQICGRAFDEATVLRAGVAYQHRSDWHLRAPDLTALVDHNRSLDFPEGPVARGSAPGIGGRKVKNMLDTYGIVPYQEEEQGIADGESTIRELAEILHSCPVARYEAPSIDFVPLLSGSET